MKIFRSRLGQLAASLVLGLGVLLAAVDDADARRVNSGGFGSRGVRTFQAPPATPTAPGTAAPIDRSMTPRTQTAAQPGPGPADGRRPEPQPVRRLRRHPRRPGGRRPDRHAAGPRLRRRRRADGNGAADRPGGPGRDGVPAHLQPRRRHRPSGLCRPGDVRHES